MRSGGNTAPVGARGGTTFRPAPYGAAGGNGAGRGMGSRGAPGGGRGGKMLRLPQGSSMASLTGLLSPFSHSNKT